MPPSVNRRFALPTLLALALGALHLFVLDLGEVPLERLPIFLHQHQRFEPAGLVAAFVMLGLALLVVRWLSGETVDRCLALVDRQATWIAIASAGLLAAASVVVYHAYPLAMDEYSALFQARLFAAGQLWAELQPGLLDRLIPPFFQQHFFATDVETGRVISSYWPGFSLLMTPFEAIGAPWLLNPILVGISLLLARHIGQQLFPGTDAGPWALLLALASPQFLVYGISLYAMSAHLALNLGYVALLLRPTFLRAFAAGLIGSLALALHQPVPHPFFALPWILWLATRRDRWPLLTGLALGYLPLSLVLGVGWGALVIILRSDGADPATTAAAATAVSESVNAHPLAPALTRLRSGLGFFAFPSLQLLHDRLLDVEKLFLWSVPGLPVLAFWGWRAGRETSAVRALGWSAVASFLGYLFVPLDQGHGWGFRYFHQAWGVLPILAAGAVVTFGKERPEWRRLALVLVLLGLVAGTALRFWQVEDFVADHIAQRPPTEEGVTQILFIDVRRPYYRQDLIQNDPLLRDPALTLLSFGAEDDERFVRQNFPGAQKVFDDGYDTVWRID